MRRPAKPLPPLAARIRLTPRDSALAEWRRIDLTQEEKALANRVKTIGQLVPGVLKGMGLEKKQSEAEIAKVWNNLMDPLIVAHAQPVGLHKGTLFVNVDSSVWLNEIVRYRRREILQRLHHSFGPDLVQRISFRATG
jgi:predicted nucleic acid-binding Zn ribbon protein